MRRLIARLPISQWLGWGMGLYLMVTLVACNPAPAAQTQNSIALESHYTDEQPALSGNGQFLVFVSNRDGDRKLIVYDLQKQQVVDLPRLNQPDTIAEHPSLSLTGRYITYITSDRGRPVVALYDRATQRSQILTSHYRGWVRNPNISPDGRYIVFETSRRGQWDIEVLDRGANVELDIPNGGLVSRP